MLHFLSYGGGVNSTALLLELHRRAIWDDSWRAVFCDAGAERQRTLDYVAMMRERFEITTIVAECEGIVGLYTYCLHYRIVPMRRYRWCTAKFKIQPLLRYMKEQSAGRKYIEILGYCAGEEHRLRRSIKSARAIWAPLIDWGIDRQGCVEIIEQAGFPVPAHSGCFICPFMRRDEVIEMRHEYPDEFAKAARLENAVAERQAENGQPPFHILESGSLQNIAAQERLPEMEMATDVHNENA